MPGAKRADSAALRVANGVAMSIPRARDLKGNIMKIEMDEGSAAVASALLLSAVVAFCAIQIRGCHADRATAKSSCISAGGDPYLCCKENSGALAHCLHLRPSR